MTDSYFEIRLCKSCGLRYPLLKDAPSGGRCPICLGESAAVLRKNFREDERVLIRSTGKHPPSRAVLLDNIRSAWNVGSILRSADGLGFDPVYLCGITATPDNEAVRKTSLGAEDHLTWSYHKDAVKLALDLKNDGWQIIAIEEGEGSKPLSADTKRIQGKWALVLGSEVTGVDPDLLSLSDEVLSIPMRGHKRSLNVAIAFSIAAFTLKAEHSE